MAAADRYPRIRSIIIVSQDVFGPNERLDQIPLLPDLTFLFSAADVIHVETRDSVIRRELLLREGDPADPALIEESERNLRTIPFLRRIRVYTLPAGANEVDLVVRTQDTWTLEPRLSFSSGGGHQRSEFGIVEKNLLGFGKRVLALYQQDIDRSSAELEYDDPRLLGSRWHLRGNYQNTSDGRVFDGLLQYPFFSLGTPWAGGVHYASRREENKIFAQGGEEVSRFRRRQEVVEGNVGRLLASSPPGEVRRLGVFYRYAENDFPAQATGPDPSLVPEDRLESGPGVFFHREVVRFAREKRFNLFERVEDFNLGNIFDVEVGYSAHPLGARRNEPIATIIDRQGFDLGRGRKAFLFGLVTGRYADGEARNAVLEIEGVMYHRMKLFLEQTFVTRVKLDLGHELDRDVQLFLGNDNGLRGFTTRQFVGSKRFVFNFEDRIFFVDDLFHLVSLGAVFFLDTGYVWGRGQAVNLRDVKSSIGIGFRVDALRAAGEQIFRFDLAFPLSSDGGRAFEPDFSFGSDQAFRPFSGPFDLQTSSGS